MYRLTASNTGIPVNYKLIKKKAQENRYDLIVSCNANLLCGKTTKNNEMRW